MPTSAYHVYVVRGTEKVNLQKVCLQLYLIVPGFFGDWNLCSFVQARKPSVHDILQIVRHGNLFDVLVPDQISQAVIDGVTGPARNDHVLSVAFVQADVLNRLFGRHIVTDVIVNYQYMNLVRVQDVLRNLFSS